MANEGKKMEGIQQNDGSNNKVIELADELSKLTIAEASELCRVMQELGYIPLVQQASVQAAAPTPAETPSEEKKSSFNLIFKELQPSANKLSFMKLVRTLYSNMDLSAVKKLTDTPGSILATDVSKEQADNHIEQFKAIGAVVVAE